MVISLRSRQFHQLCHRGCFSNGGMSWRGKPPSFGIFRVLLTLVLKLRLHWRLTLRLTLRYHRLVTSPARSYYSSNDASMTLKGSSPGNCRQRPSFFVIFSFILYILCRLSCGCVLISSRACEFRKVCHRGCFLGGGICLKRQVSFLLNLSSPSDFSCKVNTSLPSSFELNTSVPSWWF